MESPFHPYEDVRRKRVEDNLKQLEFFNHCAIMSKDKFLAGFRECQITLEIIEDDMNNIVSTLDFRDNIAYPKALPLSCAMPASTVKLRDEFVVVTHKIHIICIMVFLVHRD
ncbi:hypothetical protein HPP92_014950 [Vanilla planifolia]|uniref:Uncharacterized protein n=1 Tax=Vanilla planifolia TaxID=51239 RepID=A0A835QMF8_VANPL|nr:hypothetical protein HPP92_014950 [Vanilla planifolia]